MKSAGEKRGHGLTVIFTATLAALCVIVGSVIFGALRTEAAPSETHYKYYTSIRIERGDTLWSVAAARSDGFDSGNDFIREVIRINHLTDENIREGDYLIIPYYSGIFRP